MFLMSLRTCLLAFGRFKVVGPTSFLFVRADELTGCAVAPGVTNFMKSDSASRDGCTSPPTPKNRQKLMIRGRQSIGSMRGRGPSPINSLSSTCSFTICTSNTLALTFLPKGRKSWTTPSICIGHWRTRGGATNSDPTGVNPAMPNLSGS